MNTCTITNKNKDHELQTMQDILKKNLCKQQTIKYQNLIPKKSTKGTEKQE
jgi:hypothetical protein